MRNKKQFIYLLNQKKKDKILKPFVKVSDSTVKNTQFYHSQIFPKHSINFKMFCPKNEKKKPAATTTEIKQITEKNILHKIHHLH